MDTNPPRGDTPGRMTLYDYTDLKAPLTPEQQACLRALDVAYGARDQQVAAAAADEAPKQPAARLNSGYDIPLVGLGTW